MNPAPDRQPLLRFVAASALLHLLAAGVWHYGHPPAAVHTPRVLAVQLQTARQEAPRTHKAAPRQAAGSVGPARQAPARHPQPAAAKIPPPALTAAQTATPRHDTVIRQPHEQPAQDTVVAALEPSAEARVRAAINAAFRARFVYPRRARVNGWQGTVVIALCVLPDGGVRDVRVADSSGIAVLDRAALQSLQNLRVPQAVAWMAGREMAMMIPVEYRLTDS